MTQIKICQMCKIVQKKCVGGFASELHNTIVIRSCAAATAAPEALSSTITASPKTCSQKDKGPAGASPPCYDPRVMAPSEASKFPTYNLSSAHMDTVYTQFTSIASSQAFCPCTAFRGSALVFKVGLLMMLTACCACNRQHTLTGVRSRTAMRCSVGARMGSSRIY